MMRWDVARECACLTEHMKDDDCIEVTRGTELSGELLLPAVLRAILLLRLLLCSKLPLNVKCIGCESSSRSVRNHIAPAA